MTAALAKPPEQLSPHEEADELGETCTEVAATLLLIASAVKKIDTNAYDALWGVWRTIDHAHRRLDALRDRLTPGSAEAHGREVSR